MKQTNNTFETIVKAYNADPKSADALNHLATAVTYSVLKKVIDPQRKANSDKPTDSGMNPALVALRREVTRDRAYLARLDNAMNGATGITYGADGDAIQTVIDPTLDRAASELISETLGDGLDLVHEAMIAILDETRKQAEREPGQPCDLERLYTVTRLKRKVWIKSADSANAYETVETTPIQEAYRAVRRAIQASRAMRTDPRNGYCYLEEALESETIYRRLPKYADLGGRVCDYNGKETVPTTADTETVERLEYLIESLKLTDREMTVLKYRLSGYGYKAIATAMGVTVDNAKRCGRRIREKATAAGLTPNGATT